MKVTLHNLKSVRADCSPATAPDGWLTMFDRDGNEITIFMEYRLAEAIVDAWYSEDDEPEPPTYDDALATKCDVLAREREAMKLKGMV
ncbi:hypothetical protein [Roseovarius amoyensis]|uniref:hypothetical protein n=1 Tax=Roseovarius amoyensis TaxID=2211448 RepID=UPI0013A6BA65|nr:hypothetical protein [Roseovarius amoyensis]